MDVVDTGTTAFMLCCIIGLTLMIPGLALFYGGMVSVKSSTNMMMMTFGAVAVVGVLWVLFGFSMVFGTSYGGFVGSFTEFAGMKDLLESQTTISGLRSACSRSSRHCSQPSPWRSSPVRWPTG